MEVAAKRGGSAGPGNDSSVSAAQQDVPAEAEPAAAGSTAGADKFMTEFFDEMNELANTFSADMFPCLAEYKPLHGLADLEDLFAAPLPQ